MRGTLIALGLWLAVYAALRLVTWRGGFPVWPFVVLDLGGILIGSKLVIDAKGMK